MFEISMKSSKHFGINFQNVGILNEILESFSISDINLLLRVKYFWKKAENFGIF